ncbi:Olfactory receptor 143, partial [Galemys pyrenaicus]
ISPLQIMAVENGSSVTEFILEGITHQPQLQLPFFLLLLLNYMVTVVGNFSLINLICLNPHLHTPMYFFILNLSFIDLCHAFVITPKMLMSFVLDKNIISFEECMTQLFFFCFFVHSECYVLTAMAYDRYVAIGKPLMYTVSMSPQVCALLITGSYVMGFAGGMVHTGDMLKLSFCDANIINHYMCDIFPLQQLSCSSTYANELVDSILVSTTAIMSTLLIFISYALILSNILHMSSSRGWSKAFSICSSHIMTVAIFYGSGMFTHLKTSSGGSLGQGRFFSVFYTNIVPMLNPFIYSLRNKDVKLALKKTLKRMPAHRPTALTLGQALTLKTEDQSHISPLQIMAVENGSSVTEFILEGITHQPQLQLPFFLLLLLNYMVTVVGNFSLINLICLNPHLHTPMYFFILNLSFIDLCHAFVITPKMLMSFVLDKNIISFEECMTQLFFFCFFVHSECYVLTAMAYDRYVAIGKPLMYTVSMSPQVCALLITGSYVMGFAGGMVHTGDMLKLSFCDANIINHYMCDIFPLQQLSCSSTYANELVDSILVSTTAIMSTLLIFISYALILSNILHMSSSRGWSKAFSTCGSHMITVALFYGSGICTHLKTSSDESLGQRRFFSVVYTNILPMLNPFIYSLRNKDVKLALKKTIKKIA